jgi:LPS-assembly protein
MSRPQKTALAILLPVLASLFMLAGLSGAHAQLGSLATPGAGQQVNNNEPVTFTADQVEYDRQDNLVIARGHVEAWQNDHVLRADEVTFDRNTGVAAAKGHVVLLEPDGQILFAEYAEMSQNMQQGVLKDMAAMLTQNARLVANGARRTDGEINEMSKVVYSTCNLCKKDPTKPPLWQIEAQSAVQDLEHKRVEFYDAWMMMDGIPVGYFPFMSQPDPSVRRQSGLLAPWFGDTSNIGIFYSQPYYWVIDDQSDATISPMLTSRFGPNLDVEYRRRFDDGSLLVNASIGDVDGTQGTLVARGQFSYDETWRWGFDIDRASSANYVNDFHIGTELNNPTILTSQIYVEGFGEGSYARLDTKFYQGLTGTIVNSELPVVLPRYEYSYFGTPDAWGGRLSVAAGAFNVLRDVGTNTRRVNLTMNWERPFTGDLGDLWTIKLHGDAVGYDATDLNEQPNWAMRNAVDDARALPQAAVDVRWPFARDSGSWGSQLLEPMAEVIVAPQTGTSQLQKYPNEDSLDFEFTDANLFGFNRFPGIDRLEGGVRANVALHAAWYLGGTTFDGLIGQSYQTTKDSLFPEASGLHDQVSDIVARTTFTPTSWFNTTVRGRFDKNSLALHAAEAISSVGVQHLRVGLGYIYTNFDPYTYYDQPPPPPNGNQYYFPRNEITSNVSSQWGNYRLTGFAQRNLALNQMVGYGGDAIYEDECFIFDLKFVRRIVSLNGDGGSTAVVFLLTFKTIGQFGYRAL